MKFSKIVLTGGPCAGKSTGMSWIQNAFTQMGYHVVFLPETATELVTAGIAPWNCGSNTDFQKCLMKLQIDKESLYDQAAKTIAQDKVLVVCDRGTCDNFAYMNEEELKAVMDFVGSNEVDLRDRYDAVFHLVTAAKGAEEFYTTANNQARRESAADASILDDNTLAAWTGHPYLRVIDNSSNFEDKMKRLITEIAAFLGEPQTGTVERKFLIRYPDIAWLEANPNCQRIEIIQTFLNSRQGEEVCVRQRGLNGHYIYFQTITNKENKNQIIKTEQRLSQEEYLKLLMEADTSKRQIRKTRYCLTHQSQYFEIDVYPFWSDQAIAEIKLSDENATVVLPEQLTVVREVTGDPSYSNSALADM